MAASAARRGRPGDRDDDDDGPDFSDPYQWSERVSTIFPKWTNALPTTGALGALGAGTLIVGLVWYTFTPKYWDVGYMPDQPGPVGFPHQLHAGKLGMDCRYCHTNVEKSAEANIPNVETCYGCHADNRLALLNVKTHKDNTQFVRDAYAADESIVWRRVHKVPDYVRNFPHNAHLSAGVSCLSCHGNIARMPEVYQHEPLSMGWCLDCHRNPEENLVPLGMQTRLFDVEQRRADGESGKIDLAKEGAAFYQERKIHAPENCGACHY
ncbi:cytochrome c3 family protein [soil metagenome]